MFIPDLDPGSATLLDHRFLQLLPLAYRYFQPHFFSAREVLGSKGEASFPDLENTEWKNGMKPLPELGMGF
jgi:hypothetical protein